MKRLLERLRPLAAPDSGDAQFVGLESELETLDPQRPVMLCGDLVFISQDEHASGLEGFVRQPDRPAGGALAKGAPPLKVWISPAALKAVSGPVRAGLGIDHILRWGLRQRDPVIVASGYAGERESNIEITAFGQRKLLLTREARLPGMGNINRFRSDFDLLVRKVLLDLEWDDGREVRVFVAPPLPEVPGIEYLDAPFRRFRPARLSDGGKTDSSVTFLRAHGLPLLIAGVGVAAWGGLTAWDVSRLAEQERVFDEKVSQQAVRGNRQIGLERLQAIGRFLESRNKKASVDPERWRDLMARVASVSDSIRSFRFHLDPKPSDPDFTFVAIVPATDESPMSQGSGWLPKAAPEGVVLQLIRARGTTRSVNGGAQRQVEFHVEGRYSEKSDKPGEGEA